MVQETKRVLMRYLKFLFLILVLSFIFSSSLAFPIGVLEPEVTCIKPDRTYTILVEGQSGAPSFQTFDAYLRGPDFMKLELNQFLFFPSSIQKIPVFLNTTDVSEGTYSGNFTFCLTVKSDNTTELGIDLSYCVPARINVNVSKNCAEIPVPVVEKEKFLGLIEFETFKPIFNITVLIIITACLALLIAKTILKKKHKTRD